MYTIVFFKWFSLEIVLLYLTYVFLFIRCSDLKLTYRGETCLDDFMVGKWVVFDCLKFIPVILTVKDMNIGSLQLII